MIGTAIIIVNYNGEKFIKKCLDSVLAQSYQNFDVYVLDNNSSDNSTSIVEKIYLRVKLIKSKTNTGFAEGNNIAIKKALGENPMLKFIVTLNIDTIVEKRWLEQLIVCAEKNPKAGSIGSKALYLDSPKIINTLGIGILKDGSAFHVAGKQKNEEKYTTDEEIFGPCAVAALYRVSMLNKIGLFDETFFAYLEDVDLAWRARLAGWQSMYANKAIVYHAHSAIANVELPSAFKLYLLERNRLKLLIKNFPASYILNSLFFNLYKNYMIAIAPKYTGGSVNRYIKIGYTKIVLIIIKAHLSTLLNLYPLLKERKKISALTTIRKKAIHMWFSAFSLPLQKLLRNQASVYKKEE